MYQQTYIQRPTFDMCETTNKRKYFNRVEATRALTSCVLAGRSEKRIYRCPFCDRYHLTSQVERKAA